MPSFPEFKVARLTAAGTLTERVVAVLVGLIRGEDFLPGSRLPSEMSMASRFGVSRTVIREAVSRLKADGLVESRQGSGVFIRKCTMDVPFRIDPTIMNSIQSLLQVIELRLALEGEIAAFAATRRTTAQMRAITQALEHIENDEHEGNDGVDADIVFHHSIAEATGNPHLLALIEFLLTFLRNATAPPLSHEATKVMPSLKVKDEHSAIVAAISKQDPEAARAAARKHIKSAAALLRSEQLPQCFGARARW